MLAVVQPMTPTSTSPTPPTMSTPGSGPSHSSSSGSTLPRRTSATTTVNYRPPVPSRAGASSGSVHFQHQLPPSRAPSYHVNGHASSSTSSASSSTTTAAPTPQAPLPPRAATPPPAPPPDSHSQPPAPPQPTIDISSYSSTDLLKLLASLLTQIAATNDSLSTSHSSNPTSPLHAAPSAQIHSPIWSTLTSASRTALSTPASTLTFHARNIPTISLESYFLRILKYCPTTNHVFLSLLVYFDRMAKLSLESTGRAFVIDSYNVHRLVIAGVTVASKFFSDVFYTNSRYAKVGGLPLPELNQLELQFLLLNDFRLVIKGDEMQRYAEQLILFSKSSGAGKEKEIPRDGHSAEAGTSTSPHRPIVMARRDSQNAYSSFPSAAAASTPGHTRTGSGGSSSSTHPSQSMASSSSRTPTLPFSSSTTLQALARRRSATPPDTLPQSALTSHSRPSSTSAPSIPSSDRRRMQPPGVADGISSSSSTGTRRTPPIHVSSRHAVKGRAFRGETPNSDEEEEEDESDDYDSEEEDEHAFPRRRRRREHAHANDTETETETDAGETTDGGSGSTTSDEPTVRPVRRRSLSASTSSFGDPEEEEEEEDIAQVGSRGASMEVDSGRGGGGADFAEGEGTPDVRRVQHTTPRGEGPEYPEGDVRMGSPRR